MKYAFNTLFTLALVSTLKAQHQIVMKINQNAPVKQSNEIFIDATPEKVWSILTDIGNWPGWNQPVTKVKLEEPVSEGTTFVWKTNGTKISSKIHTFNKMSVLGWTGKTFGAKAIHNWYFTPALGGTVLRVEESMEGWLIGLMKNAMNQKLTDDMQSWLNELKVECEQ